MQTKLFLTICTIFLVASFYSIFRDNTLEKSTQSTSSDQQATLPRIDTNKIVRAATDEASLVLTAPIYVDKQKAASFMQDTDDVLVLKIHDTSYIFPLWLIGYHQIVNGEIDTTPVAITYCPLADTARAFNRNLDNDTVELETRGDVYAGNLIMYDRKTESSFLQLTGQGFSDIYTDKMLSHISPLDRATWKDVKNGTRITVLAPVNDVSFYRAFWKKEKSTTEGILSLTNVGLQLDTRLAPFTRGIGVVNGEKIVFVPLANISYNAKEYLSAQFSTQVYWYVWAGLYPKTEIIE